MIQPRAPTPLSPQIRAQATEWLLRFSEGEVDVGARENFVRWLRASPEHVRAYLRICALWQDAPHVRGEKSHTDIDALVKMAQREANIIPWEAKSNPSERIESAVHAGSDRYRWIRSAKILGLAASILIFLSAGAAAWIHARHGLYSTSTGEQRTVNLPDGSTVVINARSSIRVAFGETERGVELLDGQALFRVARNATRPFIVHTGNTSVRAVGTQFDVYKKSTSTVVSVVEGRVAIVSAQSQRQRQQTRFATTDISVPPMPGQEALNAKREMGIEGAQRVETTQSPMISDSKSGELLLAAGEQAIVTTESTVKPQSPNIAAATAWTEGLLVFDGAPLSEVIEEFNRQNSKAIVLSSPGLSSLQISGSFPASGSERVVRFLQERFHVVVHETDAEIQISRP